MVRITTALLDAAYNVPASMTSPLLPLHNPYLFVVGCPRSGTTLLQRMLDAHPQLAVANDTHFIPRVIRKARPDFVANGPAGSRLMLTPALIDQVRSYHRFLRLGLDEATVNEAAECSKTYSGFVSRLYLAFARLRGKGLGGEKTPDYVRHLCLLHSLFPWVRSVHIIRDGRDVALSALEWAREDKGPGRMALWKEEPVAVCALWWRWQVMAGRRDAAALPPHSYLEVRYEHLVEGPEETLRTITDFLQLPFAREEMLGFNKGRVRHKKGLSVKKAWLSPTPGVRDWRTQMDARSRELFEALAADLLSELGYERQFPAISPPIAGVAAQCQRWWDHEMSRKNAKLGRMTVDC